MTEAVKVMRFGRVEGRVVALRRLTVGEQGKLGLSYMAIADRPYVATVELDCPVLGKSTVEKLVAARCADDEIRLLKDGSAVLEVVVAREEGRAHGASSTRSASSAAAKVSMRIDDAQDVRA